MGELIALYVLTKLFAGASGGGTTGSGGADGDGVDANVDDVPLDPPTTPPGGSIEVTVIGTANVGTLQPAALRELAKDACAMLTANGTMSGDQLRRALGKRAYSALTWPPPTNATASHRAAWQTIDGLVTQLQAEASTKGLSLCDYLQGGFPESAQPTNTPTSGKPYKIRSGDNLYKVAGAAYGLGAGGARLQKAKDINAHPANAALSRVVPPSDFDKGQFPAPLNVISFGTPYQVVYIP